MVFCDKYAFIDESGTTNVETGRMLVISAILTDECLQLARTMKSAEKKNRSSLKRPTGEMKAASQLPGTRKRVLSHLMRCKFLVYSLIFDLATIHNTPYRYDDIYTVGMSKLCSYIYTLNPGVHFVLDKRYTKESLRFLLSQNIKNQIIYNCEVNAEDIDIVHGDSIDNAELRAADYVVYETYQKYKFGSEIYNIFEPRVEKIIYYGNTTWGQIKKESRTPYQ
ncbi:MAG: DUF3800 domain-containing protein [Flexilinea sp.]|nr:DUF3800 domain-containing protein [Flexilinea sp.]